jgi:hypothetical protein
MAKLMNLARESTVTTGTGTITLGGAVSGCLTFALAASAAGVSSGDTITYGIEDGANSEVGRGVWNSAGTLTRATILASTNGGSAIALSGTAEVFCIAAAQDIGFRGANVTKAADQTLANYTGAGAAIAWDSEIVDVGGWHDNATFNNRLTVPAGVNFVVVTANVYVENLSAGQIMALYIQKGGTFDWVGAASATWDGDSTSPTLSASTGPVPVTAGEYFDVLLAVQSDNSISVMADRSNFSIRAVG